MKPLPLRTRLGLWASAMLALPLLVFAGAVAIHIYHQEVRTLEGELRVEAASVLQRARTVPRTDQGIREVSELIEPFHPFLEISSLDGTPPYRSPALAGHLPITDPSRNNHAHTMRVHGVPARVVTLSAGNLTVALGAPLARARARLGQLLKAYLIAAPPLLLAFAGGAAWMTRRALRPLREIAERAEAISTRSLNARLPVPEPNDEVRALTEVLNRMMSRLESGFAHISRFTADASHELRTPLTIIRGELESALGTEMSPEARVARIQSILEEVRRMSSLVDSLLILSRSEGGNLDLAKASVDLSLMVASAAEDARTLGEPMGLDVALAAPEGVRVTADRGRLRQILLNLIDNAVKFNRAGGTIRMRLETAPGTVTLYVGNSGRGLSAVQRERLFERFFRGDTARSRAIDGFGLGLALSRDLARAHGGDLELTGSDPDWTEFRLSLPAEPCA
jgi:signal transduction histidine kinase